MNTTRPALASVGLFLAVATANGGTFHGVKIYSMNHWFGQDIDVGGGQVQAAFNAANLDTYRVYAVFNGPQELVGTFGATDRPMYVHNLDSGTFFNYTETQKGGGTTHFDNQQSSRFSGNPSKAYDTFATVGGVTGGTDATQFSPPGTGNDNGGVGNHFQNNWSSDEGVGGTYAWFVTGHPAQAHATQNPEGLFSANSPHTPDGRYYILLFQATVPRGDCIEGKINPAIPGGPLPIIYDPLMFFTTCIPTPGAFGLLSVWGIAGCNRRRRVE